MPDAFTKSTVEENSQKSYQQQGDIAFKEGSLAVAASLYSRALEANPQDSWAEYSLAEVYRCQGDLVRATHHYTQSLKLDPFSRSPFIQLLFTKVSPQQLDPIVNFYRQLSTAKPRNPWASVRLGDLLTKQRNMQGAIASYKSASYKLLQNNSPDYVSRYWDNAASDDIALSEPTYIIIGPMKTATSALYEYINQHPKVLPSIKKEIHFFNDASKLSYGKDWYLSHFPPISPSSGYITGEASPGYIVNNVHNTVFSLFPKVKIIALVREPTARAFSHYTHNCKHGFERRSFADAITAELTVLDRLQKGTSLDIIAKTWSWDKYPGYVLLGLYVHFLQQWYTAFPNDQILVVNNQTLLDQPAITMQQVFQFLQLGEHSEPSYPKHNTSNYTPATKLDTPTEGRLKEFFRPYEHRLQEFLHGTEKLYLDV